MTQIGGEPEKPRPARLFALLFGLALGAIGLGAFALLMPVEWGEAKLRFRLWRAGARPVLWEKHRGFTVDRCGGRAPADCVCVWLVHGLGDSVVTWRNFFLDPSAFGGIPVRVYAIDLPGHGGSLRRRDLREYRVSAIARELDAEIAKTVACARNALVGNSFGGWVAARMALESPARYERLVLIGSGGLGVSEAETKGLFKEPTVESLKEFQRRAYFRPRELSDREWEFAVRRMREGTTGEVRDAQVDEDRLDGVLAKIRTGTFLVWGEADRIVSRAAMDAFANGMPRRETALLPECGHLPQKECPAKLFSEIRRALTFRFPGE